MAFEILPVISLAIWRPTVASGPTEEEELIGIALIPRPWLSKDAEEDEMQRRRRQRGRGAGRREGLVEEDDAGARAVDDHGRRRSSIGPRDNMEVKRWPLES